MPYWLRAALEALTACYARYYRLPLCASHGTGIKVSRPRHLVISGPGVSIGSFCRIDPAPDAQVHLSCWPHSNDNSSQSDDHQHAAFAEAVPSEGPVIELGDYCTLSPGVRFIAAQKITTGHSCMFAGNVYVTDADWHDRQHRVFPPGPTAPVVLGDNVWLAEGVLVLKGVTIGDNTIVGAGSVVTRSLPENAIAAGNPATVVGSLDSTAPSTDRRALYETLNFDRFEPEFWRTRLAGNTLLGWLLGCIWPSWR